MSSSLLAQLLRASEHAAAARSGQLQDGGRRGGRAGAVVPERTASGTEQQECRRRDLRRRAENPFEPTHSRQPATNRTHR